MKNYFTIEIVGKTFIKMWKHETCSIYNFNHMKACSFKSFLALQNDQSNLVVLECLNFKDLNTEEEDADVNSYIVEHTIKL